MKEGKLYIKFNNSDKFKIGFISPTRKGGKLTKDDMIKGCLHACNKAYIRSDGKTKAIFVFEKTIKKGDEEKKLHSVLKEKFDSDQELYFLYNLEEIFESYLKAFGAMSTDSQFNFYIPLNRPNNSKALLFLKSKSSHRLSPQTKHKEEMLDVLKLIKKNVKKIDEKVAHHFSYLNEDIFNKLRKNITKKDNSWIFITLGILLFSFFKK